MGVSPFPGLLLNLYRPTMFSRPLGNKLQEIARLSPADIIAFDVLADVVLDRLRNRPATEVLRKTIRP